MADQESFRDRLAARTTPSGALVAMENPRVIVTMAFVWTLGSLPGLAVLAALFFWFGEPAGGWVNVGLAFSYVAVWFFFVATGSPRGTLVLLSVVSLIGVTIVHLTMGGYANSGAILMWGIPMTTLAVLLLKRWEALVVGGIIVGLAIVFGFLEQTLQASRPPPDPTLPAVLFPLTLVTVIVLVIPIIGLLVSRLSFERERAEGLLLNVLPAEVAFELKETGATTTREFSSISVLFADIVGFTPMSTEMKPNEMVDQLNEVFSHFDALAAQHGCEKIRTIGDSYMVAAGVPTPREDHAQAISSMALGMLDYASTTPLSFRFGVNSGPAVAGVVGTSKFQYDIWGDTVNTASRMESHGEPDRIQITQATYQLIRDDFNTTLRGPIEVKGKGSLTTWYLDAQREQPKPQTRP